MSPLATHLALVAVAVLLSLPGVPAPSAPSKPAPVPAPAAVNCELSTCTYSACSVTCGGGTRTCTRTKTATESNGGSCDKSLTSSEACNPMACDAPPFPSPPPSPPPIIVTASLVASAKLTLASTVFGPTYNDATFKATILPTIAKAAGVPVSAVNISSVTKTSRRHGRSLLAAAVVVELQVSYGVDGATPSLNVAASKAVPFLTKALYMTNWLLPTTMQDPSNKGTTSLTAPAGANLTCPPKETYNDARALVEAKKYPDAARVLNVITLCAHTSSNVTAALDAKAMSDTYNLLGFSNRKMPSPDQEASELFYKRALQIDPKHVAANGYLGELYIETKRPALAREVLDDLKMMCPPPTGCYSLDYLRSAMAKDGQVEGAYVRQIQWKDCFGEVCSPVNVTVGDSLDFRYETNHNVVNVSSLADYTSCTMGTNVVGADTAGAAGYVSKYTEVGTHYLVCGKGDHCTRGQKAVVNVFPARAVLSKNGTAAPSYSKDTTMETASAAAGSRGTFAAAASAVVAALMFVVLG